MAEVLDIIKGIQQAAANAFDGSPKETGLRREEPTPITDKRVIDGFSVGVSGDILSVHYHAEMPLNQTHPEDKLQSEMDQTMEDLVSYLKKEYRSVTGTSLSLSSHDKESDVRSEYLNRQRVTTKATKRWKIGGLSDLTKDREESAEEHTLDDTFKKFLKQGKPEFVQELM
jgi:hypothetical protein